MSAEPTMTERPDARAIRLLLAEDHSMVAFALGAAFEIIDDIELVATAVSLETAIEATAKERPDVILLDRRMPDGDGVDAIGQLRAASPHSRVLVFTGYADQGIVERVAMAGGAGVVLKAALPTKLMDVIRRVAAGHDSFDVDTKF